MTMKVRSFSSTGPYCLVEVYQRLGRMYRRSVLKMGVACSSEESLVNTASLRGRYIFHFVCRRLSILFPSFFITLASSHFFSCPPPRPQTRTHTHAQYLACIVVEHRFHYTRNEYSLQSPWKHRRDATMNNIMASFQMVSICEPEKFPWMRQCVLKE